MASRFFSQRTAGLFALVYLLFGCLWIFLTDTAVLAWVGDPDLQTLAQHLKGITFVLATTLLVYVLLKTAIRIVNTQKKEVGVLAKNVRDVIWSLDLNCTVQYVNPAVESITGFPADEVIGMSIREFCTEKSYVQLEEMIERFRGGDDLGNDQVFESEVRHRDGEVIPVEIRCQCIRSSDGKPLALQGVSRDLRERRAMEAQLRQAQKMEAIGTLSSGVAHEINNPVAVISGHAEMLIHNMETDETTRETLKQIQQQVMRIHRIVGNLLGYARVEEEPESASVSPAEPLERSLDLSTTSLRHDRIELITDIASDLPTLKAYPYQLQQLLLNLIQNARDALNEKFPEGHPDKKLRVCIEQSSPESIRYTVEDHAGTMAPENCDRLFEPFFTTKPPGKGTGLGLWISHGIVARHKGRIQVETEPGRFTRFVIDLPLEGPEQKAGIALSPLLSGQAASAYGTGG